MYGIVMGIVWGIVATVWWFVLLMSVVHGAVMGVRKYFKKPDEIEAAVDKKMEEEGTKKFSDEQVPALEFVSESIICLIVGSITYGIKLAVM